MRLALLLVTRGNPHRASAVLQAARSLSSGLHQIECLVGCDRDDPAETYGFFKRYEHALDVKISLGERPTGLGAVWNRCAAVAGDADILCPMADDAFPALPDWDKLVVDFMTQAYPRPELAVMAWNDLANPGQCTLPIVSRQWYDLAGLYDERFPFWFYDTCVDELYSFVTGRRVPIPSPLVLTSKKGLTQNMRDLAFWWDFYVATRAERFDLAADIREHLGLGVSDDKLAEMARMWQKRDTVGRKDLGAIEQSLAGGRSEPSEQYATAKANAEQFMAKAA